MALLDSMIEKLQKAHISELLNNIWDIYSFTGAEPSKKEKNVVLDSVEKFFLNFYTSRWFYNPLTHGFSLFILIPPYLSAPEYKEVFGEPFMKPSNNEQNFFKTYIKSVPVLAFDFKPPQINTKISEDKLIKGTIPHIDEIIPSNSIDVTYYETKELLVYTFHKIWLDYIDDVKMGRIKPEDSIWENGYLHYAGAAFVLRFTSELDLVYLGYAVGLIPTGRDPSSIVTTQTHQDVSTVSFTYQFFWYNEFTYYELAMRGYTLKNPNGHPWLTKLNQVIKIYTT
jgi:hypothetical protein